MKKNPSIKIIILTITIFLLAACAPQPQSSDPTPQATALPTPTASPTMAATQVNIDGYQPITPQNIQDMELLYELGTGKPYDVTLSPDGKTIAALTQYKIILYDRETLQEKSVLSIPFTKNHTPSIITYTTDGKQIIYTDESSINFINSESGEYINSILYEMNYYRILEINFTPNNKRLIIKGYISSPKCQGTATNYAIYTLDGTKLFDHQVCEFLTRHIYKPMDSNRTLFIAIGGYMNETPYEMYLVDNETGNTLAGIYKQRKNIDDFSITTTIGNSNLLPSDQQVAAWAEEEYNKLNIYQPDGCFSEEQYLYLYKILHKDESSMLYVLKDGGNTYTGRDILVSEIDLTTCELKKGPLLISEAYQQGTFSLDDRNFIYSNKHQITILNLEENIPTSFKNSEYLELNEIKYAYNSDGTKLLLYFNPDITRPDHKQLAISSIHILDAKSNNTIGALTIPEKVDLTITSTSNPKTMMISYPDRVTLWNIETQQYITEIPDGRYLYDVLRDAVWILHPTSEHYYKLSMFDLSTGDIIHDYPDLLFNQSAEMELIENNNILKINYRVNHETSAEIKLDIERNSVSSDFKEIKEDVIDESNISEYSEWKFDENHSHYYRFFFMDGNTYRTEYTNINYNTIRIDANQEFWDKETNEFIGFLDTNFSIDRLFFSPNHYYLTAIGTDGIIRIFGVKTNQ